MLKEFSPDKIRNIGFFGHGSSGKTSVCESLLFTMKQNTRLGSTAEGTSLLDYDEDEVSRKIGINLALAYGEYRDCLVNIVDAPGYADFFGNVVSAVRAVDSGVVVIDSTSGVEVGTELSWRRLEKLSIPRVVFVNKLGKENTNFDITAEEVRKALGTRVIPLYLPIGKEAGLSGVVDILANKAYRYEAGKRSEIPVPADMSGVISDWREKIVEAAADSDEALMERFLEGKEISASELQTAVRAGIKAGTIFPMLAGDALTQVGADLLLDLAVDVLPSPLDLPVVPGTTPDGKPVEVKRDPVGPACLFVFKSISEAHVAR
jgi:elongation factor G